MTTHTENLTINSYLKQIEKAVETVMMNRRAHAAAENASPGDRSRTIHVMVKTSEYDDGITFTQLMALRDVFQAEFNVAFEATDGQSSDAGTWFPGERTVVFTYTYTNLRS